MNRFTRARDRDADNTGSEATPLSGPRSAELEMNRKSAMIDIIIVALVRAWTTTTLATVLLVAAVALSRIWDSATYLRALPRALRLGM